MQDVECPNCGHNARQYAKLHCANKCPWLICTNTDCNTVYQADDLERWF